MWKIDPSRINPHAFTSAEDALILRGRNLFGEREWYLVAGRFMPERLGLSSSKAILQRHELLSCLIFEASGVAMWREPPEEFPENMERTYHRMLARESFRVVARPLVHSLH